MTLYVYGLADAPGAGAHRGIAGEAVRWVSCAGFHVAVGDVEAAPSLEPAAVKGHDATVRALAAEVRAFLPARFGSTAIDEAALKDAFTPREVELRGALALVADREQMTLRIFGAGPHPPAPSPSSGEGEDSLGPGTRYLRARLEEHKAMHEAHELDPVRPALAPFVQAERVERRKGGALSASVFHLIPRGRSDDYKRALEQGLSALGELRIVLSGPWPAYAFAPEALA